MANEMNEKYVKHYVEIMTSTMTEAVIKNVSLQANAKLSEGFIKELTKVNEELGNERDELKKSLEEEKNKNSLSESAKIKELENKINDQQRINSELSQQLINFNQIKKEYENVKSQVSHLETFRSELIKVREENKILQQTSNDNISKVRNEYEDIVKKLNEKIEYLQLTPAKRKKVDAKKTLEVEKVKTDLNIIPKAKIFKVDPPTLVVKDGGSF